MIASLRTGSLHLHAQALDCEMCYTAAGLEVTRCSVVDATCSVVYDSLVLPDSPILDYNTAHSGITAELMTGVTTRLADVQAHLLEIVAEETLLVRRLVPRTCSLRVLLALNMHTLCS